ncbi:MAG: type VI secretion system baseplate subunit TssK [Planctomycetota bacterium]
MTGADRVVWDEGMLLVPQHFQQWDRHVEAERHRRTAMMSPRHFGLTAIAFDQEALVAGEIALTTVAGVLPDGFLFEAPSPDPLPQPRAFAALFDPRAEGLAVHLAMPVHKSGGSAVSDDGIEGNRPTPFLRRRHAVADAARPGSEREIATAVPNLRLLFGGEVLDDHQRLQIGIVQRTDTGGFTLQPAFVPSCLWVAASPALQALLRRTVEILATRSEELAGRQRQTTGMAGAANLWLLHTLNTSLPALLHLHRQQRVHPEQLYLQLATLAGQLCTFAGGEHPRELPAYDHTDLTKAFGELDKKLRALLETVIPHRCIPVALQKSSATMHQATLPDATLLESSEFFVAVGADVPEDKLVREFPMKAKVSSLDKVQQLLMMAVPGLPLRHVPNPPDEIPRQPGRSYFRLDRIGEHWDAIRNSHSFAFHVPPDFVGLKLELMAIKE